MVSDPLQFVRNRLGERIAETRNRAGQLSPLELHSRMDAIRQTAADHGMDALEALAHCSAQLALLPGHRVAVQSCFEHMDDALESSAATDRTSILAALALRLH
jgi:hypothetical protein